MNTSVSMAEVFLIVTNAFAPCCDVLPQRSLQDVDPYSGLLNIASLVFIRCNIQYLLGRLEKY